VNELLLAGLVLLGITIFVIHWISYKYLKNKIVCRQKWDLNICCGTTDGGGINADILQHSNVPNFILIKDIYNLPFDDGQFNNILCSHTIEHIEDPIRFDRELRRIGQNITYLLPPIWDIAATFNVFEHKWLFLVVGTEYQDLPDFWRLPFSEHIQNLIGQRIKA